MGSMHMEKRAHDFGSAHTEKIASPNYVWTGLPEMMASPCTRSCLDL